MIILATIQHTGTWTAMHVLEHCYGLKATLFQDYAAMPRPRVPLLHTHVVGMSGHTGKGSHGVHPLDTGKIMGTEMLEAALADYRIIFTVRDPLSSVITRHNRHPDLPHTFIPMAYDWLLRHKDHGNAFIWPVDLTHTWEHAKRRGFLQELGEFMGITWDGRSAEAFTEGWPVTNTAADVSGLKACYKMGYLEPIIARVPVEWHLLASHRALKAWLTELGYTLPWLTAPPLWA